MTEDDGAIGKEMERNKMTCFEFWRTEETGFALGNERRVRPKKGAKGVADADDVLPDDVEITLPDGTVIHNYW